jgi:predicted DNA-binding antitoxin AbrB/MazE fold protein
MVSIVSKVIRVKYEKGVLKPIGEVGFREGEELEVVVVRKSFRGFKEEADKYKFKTNRDIVKEFMRERR